MTSSMATRVEDYLQELPEERRQVIVSVRNLINDCLPEGYAESMASGMISWVVPLSRYPFTYNKQPLSFVSLAAQKNNFALYLMCACMDPNKDELLRGAYRAADKRLDMGKSCLRFRHREDLFDDAIVRLVASTPVDETIRGYESSRTRA